MCAPPALKCLHVCTPRPRLYAFFYSVAAIMCIPPSVCVYCLHVCTAVFMRLECGRHHVYTAVCVCLHVCTAVFMRLERGRHHVYTAVCVCLHVCTAVFMRLQCRPPSRVCVPPNLCVWSVPPSYIMRLQCGTPSRVYHLLSVFTRLYRRLYKFTVRPPSCVHRRLYVFTRCLPS